MAVHKIACHHFILKQPTKQAIALIKNMKKVQGVQKNKLRELEENFRTFLFINFLKHGDPDRIRTCDPRLRRPLLYPAELRDPTDYFLNSK